MVMMSSATALLFLILLSLLTSTVCLTCYNCAYPTVSPLDCQPYPKKCAAGERCLYSTATAKRDSTEYVLKEKSCASSSVCGFTGQKHVAGLGFTVTSHCCDTDLCNSASTSTYAAPCWSRTALSLVCMALISLLASE
ncbi:uncharacterized protein LOC113656577 isoform X2 [Tachysurus fulvidraco]|uniref:uncharacterized protein LOC113656577 isoform X2 n=1 Tax=Tachysurus fulvidraco TaxID=1234273 RepID=UPI000F506D49|nr:uncharacterized protein LOC113656577 isoform X2 [Tachysurus fulvidraco]